MIESNELFQTTDPPFEESIRIDREIEARDGAEKRERRYDQYLEPYYVTEATVDFLEELFDHLRDERPGPDERNHWLYGYYGSGKSHLLTALELLLEGRSISEADSGSLWSRFDSEGAQSDLGEQWRSLHDEQLVVPLSVNLLRYQGVREQSFSEIILQKLYEARGFAERLDIAFFEEEFQRSGGLFDTQEVWERREELLEEILRNEGVADPNYAWTDVQKYRILSDSVLGGLTERATGMTENLADIQNRNVSQELAVDMLEAYRQELEAQAEKPVKLVLLLDEVTLFIGGDYQRLSELNALAESIKDVGEGNIISVVTAQSNIEDVQPGLAMKELDFGILKDRFPQQYELPSRHVGEIVQQRLLTKSHRGREWIESEALGASVHPATMLTYREVTQDTEPTLKDIDDELFVQYYPLLPYQPALFMEILSNLREKLADASKSIFSGTARAILALVAGLRHEWAKKDGEKPVISLVDFYDLVQYELEDIIPGKTTVIDDIVDDDETTAFDVRVAKAVLLLSFVPDMVAQNEANLATAVMDDLEGQPRSNVQTQVADALDGNLEKYIRPDTSTDGGDLRITDREEQRLLSAAREFETDPDWDKVIGALDEHLWDEIVSSLELPKSHPYGSGDDPPSYPVGYRYEIDGDTLASGDVEDVVFEVDVVVRGLRPDRDEDHIAEETLYWLIETDGLDELRSQVVEWWSLVEATKSTNPPESIVRDRSDAAYRVVEKLTAALEGSGFRVEASEFTSFKTALADYIDESYPSYWDPEFSRIDESHLDELRRLDEGAELPDWARDIGVPPESVTDYAKLSDVALEVRKRVGTELKEGGEGLDLATVLDRVCAREELFADDGDDGVEPAAGTLAVLWGLCRGGVFRLTTIDGEPASEDKILTRDDLTTLSLTPIPPGDRPKDVFVDYDIIRPTESGNQGYVNFHEKLERLQNRSSALIDEVSAQRDTTFATEPLSAVLADLIERLEDLAESAGKRQSQASTEDTEKLSDLLEATAAAEDELDSAEERWSERRSYLLQLDGLLRLSEAEADWLEDDFDESVNRLADQLESARDNDWWLSEEWTAFANEIDARSEAIESGRSAWDEHREDLELDSLLDSLEDHAWLVGLHQLPVHGVHDAFRVRYLDPLRNFRTAANRIDSVMRTLTNPEPGAADEADLTQALGYIDGGLDWSALRRGTVEERREQRDTLESVVGDSEPEDILGIGVLHADADALRAQLEELDLEDERPEITPTDAGVIVR